MPMFAWFVKLLKSRGGSAAVETALTIPVLILMFAGITEVGRGLYQAAAIEKGLRAGALFLARSELPITQQTRDDAVTLVKTGGTANYLVSGWAKQGASVAINVTNFVVDGQAVPVFSLSATVPFDPLLAGLIPGLDLGAMNIRLSHEQVYIGL